MKLGRNLLVLLTILVIALFAWLVFNDKQTSTYLYPDFGVEVPLSGATLGVDVSHYQGKIIWSDLAKMKIQEDSISFVYIKASEGLNLRDDRLEENVEGAKQVKIPLGLYHFFHPELSAIDQADFFSAICLEYDDTLVPVLDVEITGKCSNSGILDSVRVCMNRMEKLTGKRPMLYTYESFFEDHFKNSYLKHEVFWIARYDEDCELMDLDNVKIWQFSDRGTVNGINGYVDLNIAKPEFLNNNGE